MSSNARILLVLLVFFSLSNAVLGQQVTCCQADGMCETVADPQDCTGSPVVGRCSFELQTCCFPESTCQDMDPVCCIEQGGTVLTGTAAPCAVSETCCLPDGTFAVMSPCTCAERGGLTTPGEGGECCGESPGSPPPPGLPQPFTGATSLCQSFHGFPVPPNLIPPRNPVCVSPPAGLPNPDLCGTFPRDDEEYVAALERFVRQQDYVSLGWQGDAFRRQTGPYLGTPPGGTTYSTHHIVKIYYSPEVVDWLCRGLPPGCETGTCVNDGRKGRCGGFGTECATSAECDPGDECLMLPPGSMIIKEMWPTSSFSYDANGMWMKEECYDDEPAGWAVMVKGRDGSHDGWFWSLSGGMFDLGSPPIRGESAVTAADFFDDPSLLTQHSELRYPTGQRHKLFKCSDSGDPCTTNAECAPGGVCEWKATKDGSIVQPNYGFNSLDCTACHASATSALTFASLNNIIGGTNVRRYDYCASPGGACPVTADCPTEPNAHVGEKAALDQHSYATPLDPPDSAFLGLFPQFQNMGGGVPMQNVLDSRFPAESYDNVVTTTGGEDFQKPNVEQFLSSDQCISCHNATGLTALGTNMLECAAVSCADNQVCLNAGCGNGATCNQGFCEDSAGEPCVQQVNLSPYAEWRVSPMGLAGRDPIFFAQLESETNRWPTGELSECIDSLCLHCHGVTGQRQLALDNPGPTKCYTDPPLFDPSVFSPPIPGFETTKLLTREYLDAWPGKDPDDVAALEKAKYGGLARDGISCTACHHVNEVGLGPPIDESLFTGNFNVGPPDQLYGPYSSVQTVPMQHGLGITPGPGAGQIEDPALCGSCHTIRLPVLDASGAVCGYEFEQATYLEWVNSEFNQLNNPVNTFQSCQNCHMSNTFHDPAEPGAQSLELKIANVETNDFPLVDNRVPVTLPTRGAGTCNGGGNNGSSCATNVDCPGGVCSGLYGRHTLYGLNVFLNEMFQQFPVILGLRQIDFMNDTAKPALLTGREEVLRQAREITATVEVDSATMLGELLEATVTVTNKAGHKLPSGAGFRRAFIEFVVLDEFGDPLWTSGRPNSLGVIVNPTTSEPLASEFFCDATSPSPPCPSPPTGQGCPAVSGAGAQCYQPHYEFITEEDQVQIYEELTLDVDTTGPECENPTPGRFTSSFLNRFETVKDNRLLPKGWSCDGPHATETGPEGLAVLDPDYGTDNSCTSPVPVSGADTVTYVIDLGVLAPFATSVRATLYYQATPPHYLNDRFDDASLGPMNKTDIERLYYITSRLDTSVSDNTGDAFIDNWSLEIHGDTKPIGGAEDGPGDVELLFLDKSVNPGNIVLLWSPSCAVANDYAIYEGSIGNYYDHSQIDCSDDGGDLVEEVTPTFLDSYYLVVPLNPVGEGSYGRDSDGFERPAGNPGICRPVQLFTACP